MAKITAAMVKELRDLTGAGPLDCKKALEQSDGDVQAAAEYLKEKGLAKAQKKLGKGRHMAEGKIEVYQHYDGRLGAIVEVNCETDFVAATDQFQAFAKDISLHVASLKPAFLTRAEVTDEHIAGIRAAIEADETFEGDVEEEVETRLTNSILMEQRFVKDEDKSIQELLEETVAEIGESVQISRFAVYELGALAPEPEDDDED